MAVQSKIDIVQQLKNIGETDKYIKEHLVRYVKDHLDKYHYVIHAINEGRVLNRANADGGYVNLSSIALREFLGSRYADRVLKDLLAWGIIECDGNQREGVKCYGYRIAPAYVSKTVLKPVAQNSTMGQKLKLRAEANRKTHQKDIRWKNLTQFGIRTGEALAYIETKRTQALAIEADVEAIEAAYGADLEAIRKISTQEFFLEQPDATSRVYTNLSNLSSDLRQFLTWKKTDAKLVNLDIANSQPYIFSLLLLDAYGDLTQAPTDVRQYVELTATGKFYEYLMGKLGVAPEQRKAFKTDFFGKIFYCSEHYSKRTPEGQFFAQHFPNVATLVNHYKEEGHRHYDHKPFKHLAIEMQRREASFILGTIGKQLEANRIWYSTIHDSVVVLEEHAETVKSLIITAFQQAIGLPPTLKAEHLTQAH